MRYQPPRIGVAQGRAKVGHIVKAIADNGMVWAELELDAGELAKMNAYLNEVTIRSIMEEERLCRHNSKA